jgi:hypothetical protein
VESRAVSQTLPLVTGWRRAAASVLRRLPDAAQGLNDFSPLNPGSITALCDRQPGPEAASKIWLENLGRFKLQQSYRAAEVAHVLHLTLRLAQPDL